MPDERAVVAASRSSMQATKIASHSIHTPISSGLIGKEVRLRGPAFHGPWPSALWIVGGGLGSWLTIESAPKTKFLTRSASNRICEHAAHRQGANRSGDGSYG